MSFFTGLFSQYRGLRKEIYVLCFGRVVTNLGSMVWPMLTMILSQKLGLDAFTISVVMVGSMLIMLPASLLGGRLADKRNKKRVIVVCDSVSILCYLICAAVPLGYVSVGLMLVAGICQSMEWPSYNALVADLTLTKDRERAYSLQYLAANLGLVLSPTIAGVLFKNYLWLSFLISGVAIGLSTVLIALRIRDVTPVEDKSEAAAYQASDEGGSIWSVLRANRVLLLYLLGGSLCGAAYSQLSYLLPLDMGMVHGEDGALIYGTVSSLNCIIVVVFTPLITRLFRKLCETRKLQAGILLMGTGSLLFLICMGVIPVYYAAMLVLTWGEVFCTIADGPYLTNRIPASHRGRINSFSSVLSSVCYGACSLGVGWLYDNTGRIPSWALLVGMMAVSALLNAILIHKDRRAYPKLYANAES
ncbi:MAG: MFS transporter [Oscillospiraceae bacterium]|nr:MFS transporter [Oscillospiraceae bacterium]